MKLITLILNLFFWESISAYLEQDNRVTIELYHAIDPLDIEKFTFRGNVTISSLNVGLANIIQEPLSDQDRENFMNLAESNKFYRLKAITTYSDNTKTIFLTSSKACALVNSKLNDVLWLSIDVLGSILGITQTVDGNGDCSSIGDVNKVILDDLNNFTTVVLIKNMVLAFLPDTNSFIQKMEREREARERGQVPDNRGFFAKYWMYIVPVAFLIIVSGAANPEASAGGVR